MMTQHAYIAGSAHGWDQARRILGPRTQTLYGATGSTFEMGRTLGNGGMGHVYLALQRAAGAGNAGGQLVALKLLRPDAPQQARRLFYHEGAMAPRLHHPHIVQYVDRGRGAVPGVGTFDYLALRYIPGDTAEHMVRRLQAPLPPATVLGIIAQIAAALAYLHQRGIVHCDIKPNNLMIEHDSPRAVLIDFGIARAPDFVGQPVAVGTPQYMAPEQIDANSRCDGRADLYALGAVIYELLTGRRLFHGRTTTDIRQGRMIRPPMYELSAALGASLAQVIARCLHADPSARYADAHALLDDLRYAMHDAAIAPRENVEG